MAFTLPGMARGRLALDGEGQRDVLEAGERVQQVRVLEDEAEVVAAELRQLALRHAGDIAAAHDDVPARDHIDGRDAVQQRCFARARGTHDADELAGGHIEADAGQRVGDRVAAAEDLLDGAHRKDGGACIDGVAGLGSEGWVGRAVDAMGGVGALPPGAGRGGGSGRVVLAGESGGDAVEGRRAVAIEGQRRAGSVGRGPKAEGVGSVYTSAISSSSRFWAAGGR